MYEVLGLHAGAQALATVVVEVVVGGAVDVVGTRDGHKTNGRGYVELVGYAAQ